MIFWELIKQYCALFVGKAILAIVILLVGFKLTKWVVKLIGNNKAFKKLEPGVQTFTKSAVSILLKVLIVISAAGAIGIEMASFITLLGTIGVAVGLSLQGSLSNIAGGILILSLKPFVVGDNITVGGHTGDVTEISMFYTHLLTEEGHKVIIPNTTASNQPVINRAQK